MKIELKSGRKQFEVEELNYIVQPGEIKELPEKFLRSYDMKDALFSGNIRVVEGEVLIQIKSAKILFSAEFPNLCYGEEYGKFYTKNFDLDTISWLDKDDLPKGVYNKLMGILPEVKQEVKPIEEPKVYNNFDLNKDGVVDKKDLSIASKVLNSTKKARKKK